MADTYTTNLNLRKPQVGGATNEWGTRLNNDLDLIDNIFADAGNGTGVGLNIGSSKTLTVAGTLTSTGTASFTTIDVNGGAIDGSPIGANSASTGAFTTLSTTGLATLATVDINGGAIDGTAIGATTASTVAATTITGTTVTASGNVNTTGGELQINGTNVLEKVYPVGSIYINASISTNPATLLGFGTWVAFGAGKVIVGLDSSDTDFDTAEETGGAKTHTLTTSEIPSHTHTTTIGVASGGSAPGALENRTPTGGVDYTSSSTGGGQAHNNLQPYIVAYMWKRTVQELTMALYPITPPAGIVKNGTDYANKGRWVDGDLVRFENGYLKPIGGWTNFENTTLAGTPIAMYSYRTNDGEKVLAVGTRSKVYVFYEDAWIDITPSGFVGDIVNSSTGYGTYDYGEEDYGDERSTSTLALKVDHFSFDNWGEHLVFCCSSDGKIYQWRPDAGSGSPDTIATQISNSPIGCQAIIVSNERHLIAIGSYTDPRRVSWSDREDNTNWTSTARNTAGDLQIPTGGRALYAVKWQNDIIIFTDVGINRLYYVGSPFVYGIQDAGVSCKAISPRAIASSGSFLSWIGENSFFTFDGKLRELKSDVHDFIFDNIRVSNQENTFGTHNIDFNEIWWFFPVGDDYQSTPNKYVIWNYLDNVWSIGSMDRGCWVDQGVFDYPLSCDSSGNVYEHDKRVLFDSPGIGTQVPFCESAPIEIGNGDRVVQVNQIIPDEEAATLPGITVGFKGKFTPLGAETDFGNFTFETDGYDGYTDARFSARQVSMKVTGSLTQDFQVGKIRVDGKPRGRR